MIKRCNVCNLQLHSKLECKKLGGHHLECCRCYDCKVHKRTHNFECKMGRPIHFINNKPDFYVGNDFQVTKSRRFIAAEIEVAHLVNKQKELLDEFNKFVASQGLSVVRDGSLKYEDSFEINSNPSSGNKFVEHIYNIIDNMEAMVPTTDINCGLHIHVDSRDYNIIDIYKFYVAWRGIEPYMRQTFGARFANDTCKPIGDYFVKQLADAIEDHVHIKEKKIDLYKALYGEYADPNRRWLQVRQRRPRIRYFAVNLHSLLYRGTVEFRFHPGSVDPANIVTWGIICATIVDFVKDTNLIDLRKILDLDSKTRLLYNTVGSSTSKNFYNNIMESKHTTDQVLNYLERSL